MIPHMMTFVAWKQSYSHFFEQLDFLQLDNSIKFLIRAQRRILVFQVIRNWNLAESRLWKTAGRGWLPWLPYSLGSRVTILNLFSTAQRRQVDFSAWRYSNRP